MKKQELISELKDLLERLQDRIQVLEDSDPDDELVDTFDGRCGDFATYYYDCGRCNHTSHMSEGIEGWLDVPLESERNTMVCWDCREKEEKIKQEQEVESIIRNGLNAFNNAEGT